MDKTKITKAKTFLQDLQNLCAKHNVSISGIGHTGGVQVGGAFQMIGLAASAEAASGQLDGKLTSPSLISKIVNNEEAMVLQAGSVLGDVGTFVGVRSDGTVSVQEGRSNDDLIIQSCRLRDAFDKAFSNFKKAVDRDDVYGEDQELIKATQDYFDFLAGKR